VRQLQAVAFWARLRSWRIDRQMAASLTVTSLGSLAFW
jgi:hypothetical protein